MNVCVMKLNEVTPSDLEEAKKLGKNDRLIFLTDAQGTMSCFLLPLLQTLKVVPEYVVVNGSSVASLLFFMGLQAADINGNYFIITKDAEFSELNGTNYQHGKNSVKVFVVDSFKKILPGKTTTSTSSQLKPPRKRTPKADKGASDLDLPVISMGDLKKKDENLSPDTSKSTRLNAINDSCEFDLGVFNLPPAPAVFVKEMSKYGLERYADVLAKCLDESNPKAYMTFEFHLQTYLGSCMSKEQLTSIANKLEGSYESLKDMISKHYINEQQ